MTVFSDVVLVFEDNNDNFNQVGGELRATISDNLTVERADINREEEHNPRKAVETLITEQDTPLLTVLDWDLSMGTGGISRDNVLTYCENNHLPLCVYHMRDTGYEDARKIEDYDENRIKLDPDLSWREIGRKTGHIANGFDQIRTTIPHVFDEDSSVRPIPELLDAPPSVRGKLDQYSWGNPGVIKSGRVEMDQHEIIKRATTHQGYWILNELLEFPGALLNETALAAYLNVNHKTFTEDDQFKEPFERAAYTGPFSELENWWWTPLIDEISIEQKQSDEPKGPVGPILFERLELPQISHAHCHSELADDCDDARYYCIIKEKPVCREHSVSPDGWIPKGATRSRVSEEEFDRLKPYLMM